MRTVLFGIEDLAVFMMSVISFTLFIFSLLSKIRGSSLLLLEIAYIIIIPLIINPNISFKTPFSRFSIF